MTMEYCSECERPTGKAGRGEDSIYIEFPDKEIGPLCDECRKCYWVCGECGMGVYSGFVTYRERHEGCGGLCE